MKHIKKEHQVIIGGVLLAVVAFWLGCRYASAKTSTAMTQGGRQFTMGTGQGNFAGRMMRGGGAMAGEIIAKDDKSLTVKLQSGGSRIVFYGASTAVQKSVSGTADDLTVGQTVVVTGTANSDGSVTATSVDVRPLQTNKANNQ